MKWKITFWSEVVYRYISNYFFSRIFSKRLLPRLCRGFKMFSCTRRPLKKVTSSPLLMSRVTNSPSPRSFGAMFLMLEPRTWCYLEEFDESMGVKEKGRTSVNFQDKSRGYSIFRFGKLKENLFLRVPWALKWGKLDIVNRSASIFFKWDHSSQSAVAHPMQQTEVCLHCLHTQNLTLQLTELNNILVMLFRYFLLTNHPNYMTN